MSTPNTNYIIYLIGLSKQGRQQAFIELSTINLKNVFAVSYRLLGDVEEAKSFSVKTFLRAWDKIKHFDESESFSHWIKNIAIRLAIEELFRIHDEKTRGEYKKKNTADLTDLEELIISLSVEDRVIFVLHDLEGYSYRGIGAYFPELMADEIKTRLFKTREYLIGKLNL
ncbi:MAG: hypothetical protein M1495_08190 [Bacteroidetes bacterium]|nr:hypothetical protein [Bacteroidota bacterium]